MYFAIVLKRKSLSACSILSMNADLSRKCSKDTYIKLQHTGVNKNVVSGVICILYVVPTLKKCYLDRHLFPK